MRPNELVYDRRRGTDVLVCGVFRDEKLGVRDTPQDRILLPVGLSETASEDDRDDVAATLREDLDLASDRGRLCDGLAGSDQDEPLGVSKGTLAFAFPVIAHGVLGSIKEAIVAPIAEQSRQRD